MKRTLMIILVFLVLPVAGICQVPEWKSEVVFRADYGNKEDEYGFEGIVEVEDTSPIGVFYISTEYVYVCDLFQGNIKVYDLTGKYIRTISTMVKYPWKARPMARDLLVHDGVIYMLREGGGVPPEGQANVTIYTFDLETGNQLGYHKIYNPLMGRSSTDHAFTVGATRLRVGPHGGVWIYDSTYDESYPFVRNGKAVPKSEHTQGIPGEMLDSRRIVYNKEAGVRELISSDGELIRVIGFVEESPTVGSLKTFISSKEGEYFLELRFLKLKHTIITWSGEKIGQVTFGDKKSWATYYPCSSFQFDSEGRLYLVFADYDGVYLYRWSK